MRRAEPEEPRRLRLPRFLNAALLVAGIGLSIFWILTILDAVTGPSAPFGIISSSDPLLGGPYGDNSPDRWVANELHATNQHLKELLRLLEEIRARLGE